MPLVTAKLAGTGSAQQVIEVPSTFPWGSMNLVAANNNDSASPIVISITSDSTPNEVDIVEPGASIPAKGRYELSCRLVQAGERIFVSVPAHVSVRVEINMADET